MIRRSPGVENLRVRTLERMRWLFALVLMAAQFVFQLMKHYPARSVLWLRKLGGKFGWQTDRDGPYLLLRELSTIWQTPPPCLGPQSSPSPHHRFHNT